MDCFYNTMDKSMANNQPATSKYTKNKITVYSDQLKFNPFL